jgi:hypothetical protein
MPTARALLIGQSNPVANASWRIAGNSGRAEGKKTLWTGTTGIEKQFSSEKKGLIEHET